MSKKNRELQPDLGYIDSEGKLRDDGSHDAILNNPEANEASQMLARDAAIKRGDMHRAAEPPPTDGIALSSVFAL